MISKLDRQIQRICDLARSAGVPADGQTVRDHLERVGRVAVAEPTEVAAAILSGGGSCWAQLLQWLESERKEAGRGAA